MAIDTPTPTVAPTLAPFLQTILADSRTSIAHSFVLTGGLFDYVEDPAANRNLRDYLVNRLGGSFTVVSYSPDEGITFDGPSNVATAARERFLRIVGGAPPAAPAPAGPTSALDQLAKTLGAAAPTPSGADDDSLRLSPGAALPTLIDFLTDAWGGEVVKDDDGNVLYYDEDGRPTTERDPETGRPLGRRRFEGGDRSGRRACVVIDRLDLICPPGDKALLPDERCKLLSLLHRAGTSKVISSNGNLLLMLSPTLEEVHSDLRAASSGIRAVDIPPPDYGQRLAFAEREFDKKEVKLEPGFRLGDLAAATAGLYRRHIQDLALRASAAPDKTITRAFVSERKAQMMALEYAEVLEVLEPRFTLDQVGGHDLAKQYLLDWVVSCMRDEDLLDLVPLGVAFLGPPGTGKTMIANALAREVGFNCVLLRADKIRGGIVGESERKLAKAIAGIEALAPCIVFVDEIDQKFTRVQGGSGGGDSVEMNIFSRLLEFFGDSSHRGRILAVAASNRPDLVDAALFRPGRFDVKIPLLPPASATERADVLRAILVRYGEEAWDGQATTLLALGEQTENWTQAELERLVVMARAIQRIKGVGPGEALAQAKGRLRNRTRSTEDMIALALEECDDLELIPEVFRKLGTPQAIEQARARTARDERARRGDFERGAAGVVDLEPLDLDAY